MVKITLEIDESVIRDLEREAQRRGCTFSELVDTALRETVADRPRSSELPPLPSFDGGGCGVDVADRDALHRLIGGR